MLPDKLPIPFDSKPDRRRKMTSKCNPISISTTRKWWLCSQLHLKWWKHQQTQLVQWSDQSKCFTYQMPWQLLLSAFFCICKHAATRTEHLSRRWSISVAASPIGICCATCCITPMLRKMLHMCTVKCFLVSSMTALTVVEEERAMLELTSCGRQPQYRRWWWWCRQGQPLQGSEPAQGHHCHCCPRRQLQAKPKQRMPINLVFISVPKQVWPQVDSCIWRAMDCFPLSTDTVLLIAFCTYHNFYHIVCLEQICQVDVVLVYQAASKRKPNSLISPPPAHYHNRNMANDKWRFWHSRCCNGVTNFFLSNLLY